MLHARVLRQRRRAVLGILAVPFVLVLGGFSMGCWVFSGPRYQGPVSDHFDGTRFRNESPQEKPGFSGLLKWMTNRDQGPWRHWVDAPPGPPPPRSVGAGQMRVTFINHATVLVQQDGVNVLADPIYSERASPVQWAGPRRVRPPGIRFDDLPPIDAVVVSHNHYDHMDLHTLRRLQERFRPRFFVGLGNGALFEKAGLHRVTELDWWQGDEVRAQDGQGTVRIRSVPAQHFSNRGLCDDDATLWTGYTVEGAAGNAYFAGDTGFGPHFQQIRERVGPVRLAVLPIGAYRPEWFMHVVHVSPKEAFEAHRVLQAGTSIPMHYGTFALGDDGETEAIDHLERIVREAGDTRFRRLDFGQGLDVPPL